MISMMRRRRYTSGDSDQPEARYFRIVVFSFIGIALLMFLAGLTTFLISLRGAEQTLVPDVRNVDALEALVSLQERELYPRVQLRFTGDPASKGQVIDQSPAPGTVVRAGRRIVLVVSEGAVVSHVGSFVGRTLDDVQIELQTTYSRFDPLLRIADVMYVFDDEPAGTVLEQDPPSGFELSGPTDLKLVVSRGQDVPRISLPAYTGLPYTEAITLLARANTPFVFQILSPRADRRPGIVISQEPEPGTMVAPGTRLTFTMAPPAEIPEEHVFGVFERTLPDYPVPVDLRLDAVAPGGDRSTLFEMRHPGGPIALPYVARPATDLILYRFDTEVLRFTVPAP